MTSIHVSYNDFSSQYEHERAALNRAIQSVFEKGDFILGEALRTFESRFAALCDTPFAFGVGNGTDALILALKVLGVGPGDEVITVPNSWISTVSCIVLAGAKPVLVDVGDDMNIDPDQIEAAVTPRTRAIIPVHLTGRPARMDRIVDLARTHNLHVIEDAAQSVGAKYDGHAVGSMGEIGCFSLHPLKNLNACGDGGMVVCRDEVFAEKIRLMRNHGLVDRDHVRSWGMCTRLDTIQAAILNCRLDNFSGVQQTRQETAAFYNAHLKPYAKLPEATEHEYPVYHTYIIQTERRDALAAFLKEKGISVKIHYPIPIHLQEAASELGYREGDFPNTERQCRQILSLPIHHFLTDQQKEYVVESIREFWE